MKMSANHTLSDAEAAAYVLRDIVNRDVPGYWTRFAGRVLDWCLRRGLHVEYPDCHSSVRVALECGDEVRIDGILV